MKIIKPDYYDSFHCIAGDCSFTCCQEWKIGVDDRTYESWKKMAPPEGAFPQLKNAAQYTGMKDGTRVMALNDSHFCPFLNEEGLCRMVITGGEQMISHTCHIFPREKHDFGDHLEYTLMPSCPEAVDLLNRAERFELIREDIPAPVKKPNTQAKLHKLRGLLMEIMQGKDEDKDKENGRGYRAEKNLQAVFFVLQSCLQSRRFDEAAIRRDLPELRSALSGLKQDPSETFAECNELFLDLIENYRKEKMYSSYLDPAAKLAEEIAGRQPETAKTAVTAETVLPAADESGDFSYQTGEFPAVWDKYQPLMLRLLTQEVYADSLIPEGDMMSMAVKIQWIAMEYALIRHLSWLQLKRTGTLAYEDLRNFIVLSGRMMGYEEEDIYEYMENSFESLVWEWGYFALITG